ncbi:MULTISPECIES: NADH-dependent flavin oxidoreductase [unclassified Paenibacillus]|uniref:NADH-dependent flavin oxidoreductase n=1 Tax=unclassified Paenibacillus TaxID=185978 RepID=UPI000FE22D85|nr:MULTISPECIES: NADH-dependent flavin oxidoreductase [unclassified Paenibacillus]MCM3172018.1 NADH-dependent flavin oxidoreductase [Paenibacillus sp. MER 99-2]
MKQKYSKLFGSFTFKSGVTIKNSIVMAPMTTWSSNDDLTISDNEIKYYTQRVNGVGLVITGCTHVTPNGQGFTNEFAGYNDDFTPSLRKLAKAAKSGGAPAILQIFHAGNKAVPGLDAVSSSALLPEATLLGSTSQTRELSHEEVLSIVQAFGDTTRRAIDAGFDGVEIHGAHGFLIQNFWSPATNRRTDQWGGSLENRLRFPFAIIEEIKNVKKKHATKPFIIGFRLSPEESSKVDGLRMKDTYDLIDFLVGQDLDYIHASLDNVSSKPMDSQDEKTRLELILERANGKVPVMAAGSIRTPDDALKAKELGLPLVAIGQALIMDPNWVEKIVNERESEVVSVLNVSKLDQLDIPAKLWDAIQAMPGWFSISK